MHRYVKFLPLIALFAFGAALVSWPRSATATPIAAPTWSGPNASGYYTVTASYNDDTPAGSSAAILTGTGAGQFIAGATVVPNAGEVVTVSGATITVTEDADTVSQVKTITASFVCSTVGSVTFTLSHGNTSLTSSVMTCNTAYTAGFTGYPGYTGYPGGYNGGTGYPANPVYNPSAAVVSQLGVSASPASINCGAASSISVIVRDAIGNPVPDGTSVSFTASMGSLSPAAGVTSGGYINAVYTSPASTGSAVITASSSGASGQATVSVACASAVTQQPSAPPPVYLPQPGTIISPPNTGDAGLAGGSDSSALPVAIATALTVLIGGGLIAGWSYSRENQAR